MEKILLLLLSIAATSSAGSLLVAHQALPEVGTSTQYKTEDTLGNYAFGYHEDHTSGGSFRKEVGDSLGNKIGSYGLHDADGRARVVNYVADGTGFKADIRTNEPGVDSSQDPADVTINKSPKVAVAVVPVSSVVTHTTAVAPVVTHKKVLTSPFITLAAHHHPLAFIHTPIFLTPV